MPTGRSSYPLLAKSLFSVSLAMGVAATAAPAGSAGISPAHRTPTSAAAPTTTEVPPPARDGAPEGGDLSVYVPPVPPMQVIVQLCESLVEGHTPEPEPAKWLPDLEALTGGSVGSTTGWCGTFLVLHQKKAPT